MSEGDPGAGNLCGVKVLARKSFTNCFYEKLCLYSKLGFYAYD